MKIMPNRLDRGFAMYQKEFNRKLWKYSDPAGMYLETK